MKLIKPSFEIWEQESGLGGVYKMIEKAGRVCYKSENKIAEGTAKPFVDRLMKSGHGAMLEHGTVYLMIPSNKAYDAFGDNWVIDSYGGSPYSTVKYSKEDYCVTTNLRVLVENDWLDDLKYLCEPTEYHVKRVTVHFIADAGVMREFFRHRTMSMAQESTRYCNYSKDKFGNSITYIAPCFTKHNLTDIFPEEIKTVYDIIVKTPKEGWAPGELDYLQSLIISEVHYFKLLKAGWSPQEARIVLPLNIKAEGVMTGFVDKSGWLNFFNLRALGTTGAPHPQAKKLAKLLFEEFKAKGFIK